MALLPSDAPGTVRGMGMQREWGEKEQWKISSRGDKWWRRIMEKHLGWKVGGGFGDGRKELSGEGRSID